MSSKDPSSSRNDVGVPASSEVDGAFSWAGHRVERELTPVIELSVADLEPDEADLALQDLLDDPEGARLASADVAAFASRFVAELLGEDEERDWSDDPTVKIEVGPRWPELDPREWSDGFCALGDVVEVHEQIGPAEPSDGLGGERDSTDPVWFAATLPTRPPPRPRPLSRRRSLAVLGASSVMTALVIAVLLGLPLGSPTVAEPARVGLASILDQGPPRSLEALATIGPIGAADGTEGTGTATATATIDAFASDGHSCAAPTTFEPDPCGEPAAGPVASAVTEASIAAGSGSSSVESVASEQCVAPAPSTVPPSPPAAEAQPVVERTATLAAETLTAADLERLALAHFDAGELDAAIATAELWTTVAPESAGGYLCLGAALLDRGRIQEARQVFRRCVESAKGPAVGECMAFAGRR
jgi:hypothetical protein